MKRHFKRAILRGLENGMLERVKQKSAVKESTGNKCVVVKCIGSETVCDITRFYPLSLKLEDLASYKNTAIIWLPWKLKAMKAIPGNPQYDNIFSILRMFNGIWE